MFIRWSFNSLDFFSRFHLLEMKDVSRVVTNQTKHHNFIYDQYMELFVCHVPANTVL
jgi:hypothetical protein